MKATTKSVIMLLSVLGILIFSIYALSGDVPMGGYEATNIKLRKIKAQGFDFTDAELKSSIMYNPDGPLVYGFWGDARHTITGVQVSVGVPVALNRQGFAYQEVSSSTGWDAHNTWTVPISDEESYSVGTYYLLFPFSFLTYGRDCDDEVKGIVGLDTRILIDLNSWDTQDRDVAIGWARIAEDGATGMDMWTEIDDKGQHLEIALPWGADKVPHWSLPNPGQRLDLWGVDNNDQEASSIAELAGEPTTPLDHLHRSKAIAELTIPSIAPGALKSNWGSFREGSRVEVHGGMNIIVSFMTSQKFYLESGGEVDPPPTPDIESWEDLIEDNFLVIVMIGAAVVVVVVLLGLKIVLKR